MTRDSIRRRLPGATAAVVATLVVVGCGSSSHKSTSTVAGARASDTLVTIRIPDPGNEGVLAVGKKDGSLAKALAAAGAKVKWVGSAGPFAPAAQELDANELDVAQGSITSAVGALAQKPGFKLFAQVGPDKLGEGILVRNGSPITSVQQLVGKKVAVNQGGTGEYLLLKALSNAGIPASKVTRVYLPPPATAPVFDSGQVNAWATWATYSVAAVAQGAHFVAAGGQFGSQNYSVWAVRTSFATEHPKVLEALYRYLHDQTLKEIAEPSAYVNVFTTSGPEAFSPAEVKVNDRFSAAGTTVDPISSADVANFQAVAQFFAQQKVTPSTVDIAPHVVSP